MSIPWWVWPQSVAIVAVHGYLWWRLVANTTRPKSVARRVATAVVAVLAVLIPGTLIATHALAPADSRWIAWPGYVWYGLLVYLLSVLVLAEPVRIGFAVARRRRDRRARTAPGGDTAASADPGRRLLLARSIALAASVTAAGTVGYGMVTALGAPRLERVTVPLRRLPRQASGFRIAVVSDIHIGPLLGRSHTERVVRVINRANADLVAIVGDLADGTVADLGVAAEPLRHLESRHGAYFVTGNHEYLFDTANWIDELRELGVRTLRNERLELPAFDLAGVNDLTGGDAGDGPDYDAALGDRDPDRPVVLMAHQPVQVHEAAKRGVDLQLSGHTHGGQLFPLSYLAAGRQPLLAGHGRVGDTQVYVTKGAGFWGPPVRVGAPPDVTVVELAVQDG